MKQRTLLGSNKGESAASFCCQMAAWHPDMFCNFYLVKMHKIVKNQTALKLEKKKISRDLESLEIQKNFNVHLTKFKNNEILLDKVSNRNPLKIKLFIE
jgi:hypothetical protein